MEELVAKLRDVQALAQQLQARQCPVVKQGVEAEDLPPNSNQGEQAVGSKHNDWLDGFRATLGSLNRPLVVLSLFDGIGGAWAALERVKIPYTGYSSEINEGAIRVIKAKFPRVKHLGDVKDISWGDIKEDVDLLIGGFPCQDLSSMGKREGLHASRSRLFFDMLRVMHLYKPKWFLVENVASMGWCDREEITKYLKCHPIEIDSQDLTPNKRRRLYWSNIPYPRKMPRVKEHKSTSLQSVLVNATALEQKIACILSNNYNVGGKGELQRVYDEDAKALRYIRTSEVEMMMGFPAGHTDVDFNDLAFQEENERVEVENEQQLALRPSEKKRKSIRWGLLGNSFSVPVISYLLSPLLLAPTWRHRVSFPYSDTYKENECSVMEPGEVEGFEVVPRLLCHSFSQMWALYNTRGHPNWYATILSRSGGRFATKGKKKNVSIRVRFMELDDEYLAAEADKWSPLRGTGLYESTAILDTQDFSTLSHRVSTFRKLGEKYFIYPGKDEVWAILDRNATKPAVYYVFVDDVQIDVNEASLKPGAENFVARCRVMQRTFESNLYRCTDSVIVSEDLAQFIYKVPFYYKSDASLLQLEPMKNCKKQAIGESKTRRKRKSRDEDDEEDDDDSDDSFM